jgi:hypothetical protein
LKFYLQRVQRTTQGVRRKKHTQRHIVQEEQLSCVRTVARSAQLPKKGLSERNLLQGVHRVDFRLSVKETFRRILKFEEEQAQKR